MAEEINTPVEDKEEKEEKRPSLLIEWIKDIVIAAVIAFLITLVIKPTVVKESSMEPNFYENDYLFLNKLAYKFGEPKKGDVIVFRTNQVDTNSGKKKLFIKRVIGVPGDTIDVENDAVYINGEKDNETYTNDGSTPTDVSEEVHDLKIPKDKYFCMGDNRAVSIDSRDSSIGLVKRDVIVGKAFFRLLPLSKIGPTKDVYK